MNVSRSSPVDREELTGFQHSNFPVKSVQCDPDFFRWRFDDNPMAGTDGPELWLYREHGRILGQQAGLPCTLKVGSRDLRASWAVDLIVEPASRLRGIGPVLSETHADGSDVVMGIGITEQALRNYRRSGWSDLGTVPFYVRPLKFSTILGTRWKRITGGCLGALADFPVRVFDVALGSWSRRAGIRLEEIQELDHRVDELWESVRKEFAVITHRTRAVLEWRYRKIPSRGRYRLYYLRQGETVIGYMVLRTLRWRGVFAVHIVDYLCSPAWTARLMAACIVESRRLGAAVLYCMTLNTKASGAMKCLGFLRRKIDNRLMIRTRLREPDVVETLVRPSDWFLTSGDSDTELSFGGDERC